MIRWKEEKMNDNRLFVANEIIDALGLTIIDSMWQGLIVALLLFVLLSFIKVSASKIRYALSLLSLLVMFTWSLNSFIGHYQEVSQLDNRQASTIGNWMEQLSFADLSVGDTNKHASDSVILDKIRMYLFQYANVICVIWSIGVLLLFLRFIGAMGYVGRLRSRSINIDDKAIKKRLGELSKRLGIHKTPALLESALVKAPLTIGYLKPIIILPLGMLTGIPTQQLESILIHELVHIKKADYLVNLIQSFIEIIFFYHPATWYIAKVIGKEREHRCDSITLRLMENPLPYAMALTSIYEKGNYFKPRLAMSAQPKKGEFTMRIFRIMNIEDPKPYKNRLLAMVLVMFFSAGLLSFYVPEKSTASEASAISLQDLKANEKTSKDQKEKQLTKVLKEVKAKLNEEAIPVLEEQPILNKQKTVLKVEDRPILKQVEKADKIETALKIVKKGTKASSVQEKPLLNIKKDRPLLNKIKQDTNKTSIKIKGKTNNESPLFYVDGKLMKQEAMKSEISPEQIESIQVYKGENAIEKFGAGANNGVVVIYTKGYEGERFKVEKKGKTKFKMKQGKEKQKIKFAASDSVSIKNGTIQLFGEPTLTISNSSLKADKITLKGMGDKLDAPLLVIDGVVSDFNIEEFDEHYDMNGIESISVLKNDDKMVELYGEKANSGVVLITTKSVNNSAKRIGTFDFGKQLHIFPNPSKEDVNITFRLEDDANVAIKAYDLNGKLVDDIFKNQLEAGQHRIKWNATNLPKGSYVIHINYGGEKVTRNVLLKE